MQLSALVVVPLVVSLLASPTPAQQPAGNGPLAVPGGDGAGSAVAAVRLLDLDGDGDLDRLVSRADGGLVVALHLGGRHYAEVAQSLPSVSIAAALPADLDGDGRLDLYLVSPAANVALRGEGAGRFTDATASLGLHDAGLGLSAEHGDLDGDGRPDLLLHNAGGDVVFWARGDGTYERDAATPTPAPPLDAQAGVLLGQLALALQASGGGPVSGASAPYIGPVGPGAGPGSHDPMDRDRGRAIDDPPGYDPPPAMYPGLVASLGPYFVNDNANEVDASDVVDGSLTGAEISDGSITDVDLATGAVTAVKLASNAVTSAKVSDFSLTGADVSTNSGDVRHLGRLGVQTTASYDLDVYGTARVYAPSSYANGAESEPAILAYGSYNSANPGYGGTGVISRGGNAYAGYGGIGVTGIGGVTNYGGEGGTGVYGVGGLANGVLVPHGYGVYGHMPYTGDPGGNAWPTFGVVGVARSINGATGVSGYVPYANVPDGAQTGSSFGVVGNVYQYIDPASGIGIAGVGGFQTKQIFSLGVGVYGSNYSPIGAGVMGGTQYPFGTGVRGEGYYGVIGMATDPAGWGVLSLGSTGSAGQKNFLQPHPTDPGKVIAFTSLEGNESGTYFRGKAALQGGVAVVEVPEEFRMVTEPEGLSVQLTPAGGAPVRVSVAGVDLQQLVIAGEADVEVYYLVNGVRRGFADTATVRKNTVFVPQVRGEPFGRQYPEALRRILVANGTLNPDFTPNEATAAQLGWRLRDPSPTGRAMRDPRETIDPDVRAQRQARAAERLAKLQGQPQGRTAQTPQLPGDPAGAAAPPAPGPHRAFTPVGGEDDG